MRYGVIIASLAALVVAGCSESGGFSSFKQEKKIANPLGVRLLAYGKYQDAGWAHLQAIGVKHVEIPVPAPDAVEPTIKKLADHGLKPVLLTGKTDLSKPECVGELAGQLRVCQQLGVRYMFLSAKSNGAEKEIVFRRLRQAGEIARTHKVTIVLETHPDLCVNAEVALQTMKAVNHPNVRINFDTANLYFYNQNIDAVTELKKVLPYVASVHLKETNGEYQSWTFPALGKGVVDFAGVMKVLEDNNFRGPFVIEIEGIKGTEWDEPTTLDVVAQSVAHVREVGNVY